MSYSPMRFEFATRTRIVFGAGAVKQVARQVQQYGRRVLVVTGGNPRRAEALLADLAANDFEVTTFAITGEPDLVTVERGTELARAAGCEWVIGIGGGSVLDGAKAIAGLLTNPGSLLDYLEIIGRGQALTQRGAPLVAIPTTAGTGAEVTHNAVLASPEHRLKVSLRSPLLVARVAVLDPELTRDLPPALTASTGMDALTQLIEPYVCLRANPITDGFCRDGIPRVAWGLRAAFHNGQDAAAREAMALASLYGGLALANAGLGAVHGFAGPIGGGFPAPHGAICAALLPHVMAMNLQALRERQPESEALLRYDWVARQLTGNPHAPADAGVEWLRELVQELGIPTLRVYGVQPEHFPDLVAKARQASSMKPNPIPLTEAELQAVLQVAW